MKSLLIIVAAMLTLINATNAQTTGKLNTDSNGKKAINMDDKWALYQAENEGKPMLIRKNLGYQQFAGKTIYAVRCGIAFKLLYPAENGLPLLDKENDLYKIEDDIIAFFQSDANALVTLVITTSGFREYVLYTKSINDFDQRLEKLKAAYPKYIFSSYNERDETWSTYQSYGE